MAELPIIPPETYEIEGEVARGGIGRILKAVDASMGRVVAIKELLPGGAGAAEARFIREALVTARLEHPSIVPVHEAGRWPTGEPFYTMKLVQGKSLLEAILEAKTLAGRLPLLPRVIAVAEAIAYAHARRVIHRDIKPSNVILGTYGETLVIDWGLAKDLTLVEEEPAPPAPEPKDEPKDEPKTDPRGGKKKAGDSGDSTLMGTVMGTPAYMPPEQARGEAVDERADVYSLGALLYHTLAGASPYAPAGASDETATLSMRRAPPIVTASEVHTRDLLEDVRQGKVVPLEEREPHVPGDLLAVVRKAMARDPADRYPSAQELAEDLRRFQTGKLVSAHQYSFMMLARRWYARNRAAATVAALALITLVAGGIWALGRVLHARGVAESERAIALEERARAEGAQRQAETRARELTLLTARASLEHDPTASLAWLQQVKPADAGDEAEARAIAVDALSRGVARHVWRGHGGSVTTLAFSGDGQWLASAADDRSLRVWRVSGGEVRDLGQRPRGVVGMAFTAEGRLLVSSVDRGVVSLDPATGASSELPRPDADATWVTFSPDGKLEIWARADFSVKVVPVGGGAPRRTLVGHTAPVLAVSFSPDGSTLATVGDDRTVRIWPPGGPPKVLTAPEGRLSALALSPDGKSAAAAGDATVRVFDIASGESVVLKQPYALDLIYTPDGRGLVTVATDGVVRLWDVKANKARTFLGHEGTAEAVAVSPDSRWVATGGKDRTVRLWAVSAEREGARILRGLDKGAQRPLFSPDGTLVAAAGTDGSIRVWDVATGATHATLTGHSARVAFVAWSPDGKRLASLSDDKTIRIWDLEHGTGRVLISASEQLSRLRWAEHGDLLLYTEGMGRVVVYDLAKGAPRCEIAGQDVAFAAFSPDATRLGYADGGQVAVASTSDCRGRPLYSHDGFVAWLAFSADGQQIASASKDRTAGVWSEARGLVRLRGHEMDLYAVAFSPDGRMVATTSYDQTARLWSLPSGAPLRVLRGHEQVVGNLAFTPDGRALVTSSLDNTLRIWSVDTGEGAVLRGHDDMIWGLAMAPDGQRVASASRDGTVRLWSVDATGGVPHDPAAFAAWLAQTTTARVDEKNLISSPTK